MATRSMKLRAGAVAWALGMAPWAGAQGLQWSGQAALASELTERGITPWPDSAVVQGVLALTDSALWSASLSAAAPLDRSHASQLVARGSAYWTVSQDWQLQGRLAFYSYPQGQHQWPYDRTEATLGAAYRDLASLEWSAIRLGEGSDKHLYPAIDLGLRWPLGEHWALAGGLGRAELPLWPGLHYRYGDAGIVWQQGPWRVALRYLTVSKNVHLYLGEAAEPHASASVAWDF